LTKVDSLKEYSYSFSNENAIADSKVDDVDSESIISSVPDVSIKNEIQA